MPSKKILEEKKQIVDKLAEQIKSAHTGVVVDYRGITVDEDTKLRKQLRESGSQYKVVKNTLLGLALKEAGIDGLGSILNGTTAVAVNADDYVAPAKILNDFAKTSKTFTIKGGFLDGKAVSLDEVKTLAGLPSKEVLLSEVVRGLDAPVTGLVTALSGVIKGLVIALNAIAEKEQKQSA